ncbi:polysaccharide deacetylase family protein [Paenactinomyces guangxiensis]|uniref:Polysaccharide deacetylase family protein n=1 Tax=Paenactinomyces guangxiensis TaxID=1490290 RepID=A0A7W1WQU0_9BACL|nr:polysaccharide deacetylase family protein [Paenactinomyces guangxiensis]MBA4494380.1 polysaccharide deacetylase family protein [Paenactinomyces guangxiensis]MBH8591565.1 polysaccharide deacetylase family protein [Paenactinomyces guangxiensis]
MTLPVRVAGLVLSAVFVVFLVQSPPVASYVTSVKEHNSVPAFFQTDEASLIREKVKKEAAKRYIKPIDARIDRVWKAIPGLNGRKVDVEATVEKTIKQKNKNEIAWVYREIPPQKSLDDLGAQPIYRGNEQKKAAAIMVNVAWGTEYLPAMLDILAKEKVKATFFLDGSWLSKHPEEAKKILRAGHEIGNHAYSHPLMSQISRERIIREITRTQKLIQDTLHVQSRWFAPPAGDFSRQVLEAAQEQRMKTVLWTVDTVDWRKSSTPEMMVSRIEKNIGPGHLILTHPTDRTVKALPQIIRTVKRKGIKLGTVGDVLSSKRLDTIE